MRKYGCLGMRSVVNSVIPARMKNVSAGNKENTVSHGSPASQCGKGRIHPPTHSVTAIDDTAIIAEYSARKNSDQRKPLYSVWKPAVSSDSASGRSKGARLVSATMATAKMKNAISPSGKNLKMNHVCCAYCACTIPIMLRVPVPESLRLVIRIAEITASPMATSYETICALERSAPISG